MALSSQSPAQLSKSADPLPPIPVKRYFTIGEVSELCGVKPHVLRYWEQEFTQLRPVKRRGNRRYYQHHEVLLVRRIRDLLYNEGFTISGARNRLEEDGMKAASARAGAAGSGAVSDEAAMSSSMSFIRAELNSVIELLTGEEVLIQ